MNNKLNIAVIGSSGMAQGHMRGVVENPHANLYAICDIHQYQIDKALEKYTPEKTTLVYKTLADDPNVDAVIIVTPDQTHLEIVEAFIKGGKHVLCEKPLALSVDECKKMIEVERQHDKIFMVGQICRMTPAFKMAKGLVDEGWIGELFFVESEYAHCYDEAKGVDNWRMTPERDGFIGGGCHAVDLLRWIAGNPTEVTAYANHKCLTDWPSNDCTIAIFKFPNNVIGKVFTSTGCKRDYTMRTVLYGTKGTIICDNTSVTIKVYTDDGKLANGKATYRYPREFPVEINNHNTVLEVKEFVDAIVNGKPSPVSSLEGAATVTVCRAAIDSAKEGRPIQIEYIK